MGLEVHALARVLDGEGACEVLDVAFGRRVLVRSRLGFGLWLRARDGVSVRVMVMVRVRAGLRLRLRLRLRPRSPAGVQVANDGCTGVSWNAETRESAVAAADGLPHGGQGQVSKGIPGV